MSMIEKYGPDKIDEVINHDNDYNFDYFAWRSLQEMYLLKLSNGKVVKATFDHPFYTTNGNLVKYENDIWKFFFRTERKCFKKTGYSFHYMILTDGIYTDEPIFDEISVYSKDKKLGDLVK